MEPETVHEPARLERHGQTRTSSSPTTVKSGSPKVWLASGLNVIVWPALVIVNVRLTGVAALNDALPSWVAVTVQLPDPVIWTLAGAVDGVTVHCPWLRRCTGETRVAGRRDAEVGGGDGRVTNRGERDGLVLRGRSLNAVVVAEVVVEADEADAVDGLDHELDLRGRVARGDRQRAGPVRGVVRVLLKIERAARCCRSRSR